MTDYTVRRVNAAGARTAVATLGGRPARLPRDRAERLAATLNATRRVADEQWTVTPASSQPRQPGESWTNRLGSVVAVIDNRDGSFDSEGGGPDDPATTPRASNPWASVCETHHTYIMHDSRALAFAFARHSDEWCEACYDAKEAS